MVIRTDVSMRFKQYAYMKDRHRKGRNEIMLAGGQSSFPGNLTPAIKGQIFKHNRKTCFSFYLRSCNCPIRNTHVIMLISPTMVLNSAYTRTFQRQQCFSNSNDYILILKEYKNLKVISAKTRKSAEKHNNLLQLSLINRNKDNLQLFNPLRVYKLKSIFHNLKICLFI